MMNFFGAAVLPAEPGQPSNGNFKFKLRTSIQPQPAGKRPAFVSDSFS